MSLSLKQRLLSIEDDFVSALVKGGDALTAFEDRWEILLEDIDSASQNGLDCEVLAIAHATSTRLAALADTSVELLDSYNEITSQLVDQVDSLMGELSLTDHRPPQTINRRSWSESALPNHPVPQSIYYPPESAPRKRRRGSRSDAETPVQASKRQRVSSIPLPPKKRGARKPPQSSPHVPPRISSPSPEPAYPYSNAVASTPSSQSPSTPPVTRTSRKRGLSDADISTTPPPGKRLYAGPRLHAVSDTFLTLPLERSRPSHNTALPSGVDLEVPIISLPTVEDLRSLDVLATTTDVQRSLVNLDTAGGFDIYPFFSFAPDPAALVPESQSLDGFLQSLICPSTPHAASTTAPSINTLAWSLVEDEDNFSLASISSPCSTPSPASTPSCPATPLLDDDLDLHLPFHRHDFDFQLPSWTDNLLLDPFAVTINESFKSDDGKGTTSSIPIGIAVEFPDWASTVDVPVHISSELTNSNSSYTSYLTPS
ncbi:hypothetical protein LXA43DRAFT_366303 [Ganoderma leucocontextum]|nr:hypothetical protein LXA43DRAFT_366303 [Ganoderma leucocontextum]